MVTVSVWVRFGVRFGVSIQAWIIVRFRARLCRSCKPVEKLRVALGLWFTVLG